MAFRFLAFGSFAGGVDSSSVLDYLRTALPLLGAVSSPMRLVEARGDVSADVPDSAWARVKLPVIVRERSGPLTVELTVAERRRLL
ncbi:MAG: hypothetical protein ABIU97_09350, partial [Dehalococcoidia bacterium]